MTLVNLALGIATAAAMYWLGMPNPLLWGVVAFVLNYVPYAGSAATVVPLTVVALVSFDGLGKPLAVAGCYLLLTTIEGQFVQPILVGRRLDVSPLIVILCLWFSGWLVDRLFHSPRLKPMVPPPALVPQPIGEPDASGAILDRREVFFSQEARQVPFYRGEALLFSTPLKAFSSVASPGAGRCRVRRDRW